MKTRESIRQQLVEIIAGLEDLIRDKKSWNKDYPHRQPVDLGWELVALRYAKGNLDAIDQGVFPIPLLDLDDPPDD